MRILLLAAGLLLASCSDKVLSSAQNDSPPPQARAVVVGNDTVMVTTIEVGKKSQVSIAVGGRNNSPTATRTDNAGRNASEGANGGNSQPTTTNSVPVWALGLVLLIGTGLGVFAVVKWQQRRARVRALESG